MELFITRLFNDYLAGPANAILSTAGQPTSERPWENWLTVELLVVALLIATALIIRSSLSTDNPSNLQHVFEAIYEFLKKCAKDAGVERPEKYIAYFATIFIFIASMNLIGIIPAFVSPTMYTWVPAGLAVWTFLYFNFAGLKTNGFGYIKHFAGPVWWMAWMIFPLEIVSLFIRPLSLTIRLYGNMFAGEQVTDVFIKISKIFIPVIFMGLHVFVALVQAYVFTMLTMMYIASATATHGGHDDHGDGLIEANVHAHDIAH